jgi:hypothetical protein
MGVNEARPNGRDGGLDCFTLWVRNDGMPFSSYLYVSNIYMQGRGGFETYPCILWGGLGMIENDIYIL